jgi:uncharacterized protein
MANDQDAAVRRTSSTLVDGIPVTWVEPASPKPGAPLALWVPYFGVDKQSTVPFLHQLADAGCVAASLDPWQHGERGTESEEAIRARVFSNFRKYMWTIIGHTTLDALRVIDWAVEELGAGPQVVTGGVSMGGDIAVAVAGIDRRVTRVASIVATPDWTRPGMRVIDDPATVQPQGRADAYAQWLYAHLNPMTHLDAYAHGPYITFECAENDTHVPTEAALRFQAALADINQGGAERVRVNLHAGLDHWGGVYSEAAARNSIAWLLDTEPAVASDG